MKRINELARLKSLLIQALNTSNVSGTDRVVTEARRHIRLALQNIEDATKKENKKQHKSQNQYQQWWGNIQSGVSQSAHVPFSQEGQVRSLQSLNNMIAEEQRKLDELEKQEIEQQTDIEFLVD